MKTRFTLLFSVIILALLLFASCSAKSQNVSDTDLAKLFENAGLRLLRETVCSIDFTLFTPEGESFTLSALQGNVVLLNFWATWCSPCREEKSSLKALYQRFKDQGLEIIAVNIMEKPDAVLDFIQLYSLSYPVLLDRDGRVGITYGVQGVPTSYLINREGKIVLRLV